MEQERAAPDDRADCRSRYAARLRLLMHEREDLLAELARLEGEVWALEEYFRTGTGEDELS